MFLLSVSKTFQTYYIKLKKIWKFYFIIHALHRKISRFAKINLFCFRKCSNFTMRISLYANENICLKFSFHIECYFLGYLRNTITRKEAFREEAFREYNCFVPISQRGSRTTLRRRLSDLPLNHLPLFLLGVKLRHELVRPSFIHSIRVVLCLFLALGTL